jgi:hypothetical protein
MAPLREAVHLFGVGAKLRDGRYERTPRIKSNSPSCSIA